MANKKKQIESLKLGIENLKKINLELKEKKFTEDFDSAINILRKYGQVSFEIQYHRSDFRGLVTQKDYTITLNR